MLEKIKALVRGSLDLDRLKKDGLVIGEDVHLMHGVIIDPGHCWLIEIGSHVRLAPRVHVLAHDASTKIPLGYTRIGRVTIGNEVFVGAGTVILPGVTIGDRVIVGAGSVVTKSLPGGGVYAGNPCVKLADYDAWVVGKKEQMQSARLYDSSYIIGTITDEKKQEMKEQLSHGTGYIV